MNNRELFYRLTSAYKRALSKQKILSLQLEEIENSLKHIRSPKLDDSVRAVSPLIKTPFALYDKRDEVTSRMLELNNYINAYEHALFSSQDKTYLPYFILYSFNLISVSEIAINVNVSRSTISQYFTNILDEIIRHNKVALIKEYNKIIQIV